MDPSDSDDADVLPALFDSEPAAWSAGPRTLAKRSGWSVVEETVKDVKFRWMVSEKDYSLDQTRVQLWTSGSDDSLATWHFQRNHLRAASHQIMALVVAMGCRVHSCPVWLLGGGGMALPMALLAQTVGPVQHLRIHVVELDAVAPWLSLHQHTDK